MAAFRLCLLGALAAGLFACAPAPAPAPQPAAPAPPPEPIDGTYRGTSTRFQADNRTCPHPGLVTLYVQNAEFFYRWDYATWVDASIGADGTVHGQADRITLLGKRNGKRMEGDITNGQCGLHFTVTRQELFGNVTPQPPPGTAPTAK
jgi:hypothetical protein